MDYQKRLLKSIPGGAHTYSRGYDQFPQNAPEILSHGKGAYVFDDNGNRYLDYGMALRAVNIGYAEDSIDQAAIEQIQKGNNLTRASKIELEAAELFIDLIDSVDMVKFTKNGSTAVSAAVKLARAYTDRNMIARCGDQPFLSYDDWFIGSTPITRGIPHDTKRMTKVFEYNNITSLELLFDEYPNQFACVVIEPASTQHPKNNFLHEVKKLCEKNNVVFILDEMITGFRWHLKGAQFLYDIKPDLCTFGKAMANGFSVSCVAGRRDIMQLGSIEFEGQERVFLLSTTHGAEMAGLGAFVATVEFMKENNVIEHCWNYGEKLINMFKEQADEYHISHSFKVGGIPCSPYYSTLDTDGNNCLKLRTLFSQEMLKQGVLMPWIALSYRHHDAEFQKTQKAVRIAFQNYAKALTDDLDNYITGSVIKPVFRKFN